MEVGDECVDGFKFEAWINEDIIFALGLAGFCPEFERARDGGADGNHAMSGCFGGLDGLDCFGWNMEPFGVHMMVFDVVATNWKKSAEADVQSKILNLNAFVSELLY